MFNLITASCNYTHKSLLFPGRDTVSALAVDSVDSNSLDSLRSESLQSYDEPQTVIRVLNDEAGLSLLGEDETPAEKQGISISQEWSYIPTPTGVLRPAILSDLKTIYRYLKIKF